MHRVGFLGLKSLRVKVIGDVHLGRRFINGVPLHRRGDREAMILEQFKKELLDDGADIVVQVGDLFDKFQVSNEVLMEAYSAICEVVTYTCARYFFLRGNHDASKDLTKTSSFDILSMMTQHLDNVVFVQAPHDIGPLLFLPYDPIQTGEEQLAEIEDAREFQAVFGHWDLSTFGDDNRNLIPTEALRKITKLVVTGHDHKPQELYYQKDRGEEPLQVICTGSMQPYSFSEDVRDGMYITTSLVQINSLYPEIYKDKCVRILLQPGETLPTDIDCLQLIGKVIGTVEEDDLDVEMGEFDMLKLFNEAFSIVEDPEIKSELLSKYNEARNG